MLNESIREVPGWYNQRLSDGGPVYRETDPGHLIVEPWNAVSSLLIILPAVFWLFRVRHDYKRFSFLLYTLPLIVLGGAGSALFHAFRASPVFLFMDFLPPAILTFSLMVYFWIRVLKKWWHVFFVIVPSVALRMFLFRYGNLTEFMAINVSYGMTGVLVGLPMLILLIRTRYYKLREVLLTIVFFIVAILFREMDAREIVFLPMGTHFLWHAFTGAGAWFILSYLFHYRRFELQKNQLFARRASLDHRENLTIP